MWNWEGVLSQQDARAGTKVGKRCIAHGEGKESRGVMLSGSGTTSLTLRLNA